MTELFSRGNHEKSGSNVELVHRIISALVLATMALVTDYLGGVFFGAFWVAAATLVFREWLGLVGIDGLVKRMSLAVGALTLVIAAYFSFEGSSFFTTTLIVLGVGVGFVFLLNRHPIALGLWSGAGLIYSCALAVAPIILRGSSSEGFLAILWLFAVVWGADIGAFFVGRTLGGPKLWPAISPKKTWSGFIGGILLGAIAGYAVSSLGQEWLSVEWLDGSALAVFSLGGAFISQAGDLFESALKRRFHKKDTGHLIPGHGGIMDRLDSFVTAAIYALIVISVLRVDAFN